MLKHWVGYDYRDSLSLYWTMKYFLPPKYYGQVVRKSNQTLVNCRMCLVVRRELKRR